MTVRWLSKRELTEDEYRGLLDTFGSNIEQQKKKISTVDQLIGEMSLYNVLAVDPDDFPATLLHEYKEAVKSAVIICPAYETFSDQKVFVGWNRY
jgi:hypothetical protein